MTTINPSQSTGSYESIKLGVDAHAQYYWVSRQVDGATPQPVQKMTYDELMLFVVKKQKLIGNVVTCYEAGAFGFHLHCRLQELGINNYVVQPQDWDERGKRVKNDRLDAAALCQRLDRYERGNKKAFSTVRIPTVDEERERATSAGFSWRPSGAGTVRCAPAASMRFLRAQFAPRSAAARFGSLSRRTTAPAAAGYPAARPAWWRAALERCLVPSLQRW